MSSRVLHSDGKWQADAWRVVRDEHDATDGHPRLLPLPSWLEGDPESERGVWLAPTDDPSALMVHFARLQLVAVDFPTFTDGRGYSIATLLRRLGYRGEMRAIGDVLVDQLFMLKRVGFTSFALRVDQDDAAAVAALQTYSDVYQAASDHALPYFRRRCPAPVGATT
jgi:uncharacterized protein (DUF934 family)